MSTIFILVVVHQECCDVNPAFFYLLQFVFSWLWAAENLAEWAVEVGSKAYMWRNINLRGLPLSTYAPRGERFKKSADFADKQSYRSADKGREGVQKSENFVDVLNGSSLSGGAYSSTVMKSNDFALLASTKQ